MARVAGSARSARRSSKPPSPGIMTSVSTRSAGRARTAASAAWPSPTASTSQCWRSSRVTYCRMSALSSATTTRKRRPPDAALAGRRRRQHVDGIARRSAASPAPPRRRTGRRPRRSRSRSRGRSDRPAGAPGPRGIVTMKVLPRPGVLSTSTSPPWRRAELLHQRQADAGALMRPGAHVLDTVEALEDAGELGRRDPDARVADDERDGRAAVDELDGDAPLERELEGVGKEIEDDLLPHGVIHVDRLETGRAPDLEPEPGLLDRRAEDAGQIGREGAEVGRLVPRLVPAGLDTREVEQRVHELEQPPAVPADHRERVVVARAQGCRRAAKQIVERPEHQGERRSKLVADVAEERRLGAVELGQRFRALALFVVGRGLCHGRPDLCGDQIEEVAVVVPEGLEAAGAGDHEAHALPAAHQRKDHGAIRRGVVGQLPRRRGGQPFLDARPAAAGDCGERPRRIVEGDDGRAEPSVGWRADRSLRVGELAVGIEQVEAHERDVRPARREGRQRQPARLRRRPALPGTPQIAQGSEPTLAEHASGRLAHDAEDAADPAGFVPHGIVGNVEVRLLGEAVSDHVQGKIVGSECLTRLDDAVEERAEDVPDLGPYLTSGQTEHGAVLAAEHWNVGVVVELDQLGTPEHADLRLRRKQDADGTAQALRPRGRGAERGGGPVEGANALSHLAAAREPRCRRAIGGMGPVVVAHAFTRSKYMHRARRAIRPRASSPSDRR